MSYLPHLDLAREPFALSTHPDFLFPTEQVGAILDALEIAALLRRGAMVCLGDAGLGKTMLCRALMQRLEVRSDLTVFALDSFSGEPADFIRALHGSMVDGVPESGAGPRRILEAVKDRIRHLAGSDGERNLVLCVDEGQRLSVPALEVLRELLNLECAAGKLLQIVIFAHPSLETALERHPSFGEQVVERFRLAPMTRDDVRMLIRHRLAVAGGRHDLFSNAACDVLHAAARGVPRRIVQLAHKSLLALVAQNLDRVTRRTARTIVREQEGGSPVFSRLALGLTILAAVVALGSSLGRESSMTFDEPAPPGPVFVPLDGPELRDRISSQGPRIGLAEELDLPPGQVPVEERGDQDVPASDQDVPASDQDVTKAGLEQPVPGSPGGGSEPETEEGSEDGMDADAAQARVFQDVPGLGGEGRAGAAAEIAEQARDAPDQLVQGEQDMAAPEGSGTPRFIVQVGAFRNFAKANAQFTHLEHRFADAAMMVVEYRDQSYHVVYLGESAAAGEAFALLRALKREHGIEAHVIDISGGGYTPLYIEPPAGSGRR